LASKLLAGHKPGLLSRDDHIFVARSYRQDSNDHICIHGPSDVRDIVQTLDSARNKMSLNLEKQLRFVRHPGFKFTKNMN
jgi:hypothetical protein